MVRKVRNIAFWIGWFWINVYPFFLPDFVMRVSRKGSLMSFNSIDSWMSLFAKWSIVNRSSHFIISLSLKVFHSHLGIFSSFPRSIAWGRGCNSIQFRSVSLISWYPTVMFGQVGANTVPIAVPWSCKRYLLSKAQVLFFNIKSIDSKIKGMLSLGLISSFYFNKKYLTAFIPKVCGIIVYRTITSKVGITVFLSVFLPHLIRKCIMSKI